MSPSPITGCAYYPEHWSEDRWETDAQLMREAGLSVVRLAEFAWDKLEPQPSHYDFAWLERAINILADAGLKIILCTPTPTPPPWLTHLHPEIRRVREDGVRVSPGGRRHACANIPAYLEYSHKIVEAITARFGNHPAVIGWQIDNEFGCGETTRCYCHHCRENFHLWLAEKYGSLDALNAAWGSQFWGMTYHDWEHVPIPGITTEPQSPAMRLDYRRFSSDSWVKFLSFQKEIVRRNSPERWITHNFMIRHWSLDYWKLAEEVDFVSYDNYPHGLRGMAETAMNLDLMYSLKQQNFWIMEQQPGPVNWHPYNPPVPTGQVRQWSHQAIAHGAEAVVYFRYRQGRFGQEQYHRGLLKWDGTRDQAFFEAQQVSADIQSLPALARPQATVGIVFDYEDLWSIELEPHHALFSYWNLAYELYEAYWKNQVAIQFIRRGTRLDPYKTVLVPSAILRTSDDVNHWREWVAQGGCLIITFRAGVREAGNISTELTLPGGLTELVGAKVNNFFTVPPTTYTDWGHHRTGNRIQSHTSPQQSFAYKIWAEILELTTAEPLFLYADGFLAGKVAATRHHIGQGEVIYLGCWVENFEEFLQTQGWIPPLSETTHHTMLNGDDGSTWHIRFNYQVSTDENNLEGLGVKYESLS